MKKISILLLSFLFFGCMDYRITEYSSEKKSTYRKGKVLYKITDTYTRKVTVDSVNKK